MPERPLPAVVIEPRRSVDACVIWLHGLGADGHDFAGIVPELGLPANHGTRFVFPHAPQMPVTINHGWVMPAWYDILQMKPLVENEEDIRHSEGIIRAFIEYEQAQGVPAERVVLAGFSQGGAIALHTALRHVERLAGVLALSTYLPLADRLGDEAATINRDTPILMLHGRHDEVIPVAFAQNSRQHLEARGYDVTWRSYETGHGVCAEELQDIGAWLNERLPDR